MLQPGGNALGILNTGCSGCIREKREKVTEHKRYNKTECESSVAKQMPFTKA